MRDPRLYLVIGFLAVVILYVQVNPVMGQVSSAANHVVINEVETDPLGDDSKSITQWVELYNPTSQSVNVGGWTIGATTGLRNTYTIPTGTNIQSGQFLIYIYGPSWFPHIGAIVQLKDNTGLVIDQTPPLYDQQNDGTTWQRIIDGFGTNSATDWVFKTGTPGTSNAKSSSTGSSSALTVTVASDKTNYIFGDIIKISGQVSKQVNIPNLSYIPEKITIVVVGSSGFKKTITAYPDTHLQFKTELKTDPILGFQEGNYNVYVTYSDVFATTQFTLSEQSYIPPPQEAQTALTLNSDKPSYILGDAINLVGNVSKVIPLTPVTYKVFDPNSAQIYQGTLFPDTNGKITTKNVYQNSATSAAVIVNPVNSVYGTYNIIAKYDTATTITSFNLLPMPTLNAPIVVTTDKQAYGLGETVTISGRVKLVGVDSFQIEIAQSFTKGVVRQVFDVKNFLNISPDGSFTYQFTIPSSTDRYGSYRVIISEKAYTAEADFNVVENPSTFVATTLGPLSIITDQSSYALGASVGISGNLASNKVQSGVSIVISVLKGNGMPVISTANQFLSGGLGTVSVGNVPLTFYAYPDSNGNYKITQILPKSIIGSGTYILKATYGKLTTSTSFTFYDPAATGNQAIVANTDKQVYGIGETVHLSGQISRSIDPSSFTITLIKPDGGKITSPLTTNNGFFSWDWTIPNSVTTSGTLATIINADRKDVVTINDYPNTYGIYRISIGSNNAKTDLFFGVSKNSQSETKLSPFFLETDKTDYTTTQTVKIFGQVIPQVNAAALVQNTMPNIVVYTKTGQEVFRTSVHVNEGGQFQTSINLRPGIYKTGEYKIYGSYLGAALQTSFKVTDPFTTTSDKLSLLLTTDTDKYLPGDTVLITGRTSYIISINSVSISVGLANDTIISEGQVVSKKGNVLPRAIVPFDQSGSFSYDYKIPLNANLGNYTVMASVPFGAFSTSFQIVSQLPQQIETPPQVNATQGTSATPSVVPSTIGPTQKPIISNVITVDKVNRITDSFIPITIKEKTAGNSTFYPRMIDGLLRLNIGDESNVNLKVTLEDGTCIIGKDADCKVSGPTQSSGSLYQTIQVGNQNFLIGYSGSGARLEKFTILPADANGVIPDGQWNIQILKNDQSSRFYYQITYASMK